ncbi:hypothetical protein CHS0354_029790 [Potamilus streckersoni]|uniref:Inositol 1,4,5-trisphosphate/ryanodine receptor domain-containing protein n=1 Tax=Potamilus streckersoni TaxID=2493646 RepID=A0AAE0WEE1_9BIVA|nr:hypothetical protein CHS0354_029790 [Potamilus streckersoni]
MVKLKEEGNGTRIEKTPQHWYKSFHDKAYVDIVIAVTVAMPLQHTFTNKYIHMCTSQTSQVDKNNMMIMLQEYNAKNAQFRILPQYKVKSEGEVVQIYDQIVFESIKSPGHFFHASAPFQIDHMTLGSEVNLGVERSGFTLIRFQKESLEPDVYVRGGSIIRLFHKELEAYMVAEGLFDEEVTEDAR